MQNTRKHRDIILVTTYERRSNLEWKPNYHTIKWFSEHLLAIEMNKTKVNINKPICIGLPILDISKIVMYGFWYDLIEVLSQFKTMLYGYRQFYGPHKNKIFTQPLQMMWKKDLTHLTMRLKDHYQQLKMKLRLAYPKNIFLLNR